MSPQVRALLAQATASYQQSQTDLKAGNLGAYQTDVEAAQSDLELIQQLTGGVSVPGGSGGALAATPTSTTPTPTTTTTTTTTPTTTTTATTTPAKSSTTTAVKGSSVTSTTAAPA